MKLSFSIFSTLICLSLFSQKSSEKGITIEPKLGMVISNVKGSETDQFDIDGIEYSPKTGVTFGIELKRHMSNLVYLKSGVTFAKLGTKYGDNISKFEASFFRIPVIGGLSLDDNIGFETGLFMNLLNNRSITGPRGNDDSFTQSFFLGIVLRLEMNNGDWFWISSRYFNDISDFYRTESSNATPTGRSLSFSGFELVIGLSI